MNSTINLNKKASLSCRLLVYLFSVSLISPVWVSASPLISPAAKWKSGSYNGGRYSSHIVTPDINENTLPQLKGGNGLNEEGLYEGIRAGEVSLTLGDKLLVVEQKTNKILAVWDSFDIGANASVEFKQPGSDSVAVNLIDQQTPSTILGNLQANGSVYLINPNGVLFGEGARVDVRGLVAAAMELNGFDMDHRFASEEEKQAFIDESLLSGIADGNAFLVNAKDVAEGTGDLPRIVIKAGAEINSDNAPVLMAGPEVINDGFIKSDGGQVVLAGSRNDVYLAVSDSDRDLRGYLVEVDSGNTFEQVQARDDDGNFVWQADEQGEYITDDEGNLVPEMVTGARRGAVINAGTIRSNLGNVTLIASEILQAGKLRSSTAVDVNGSIRIIARDRAQVFDESVVSNNSNEAFAIYIDDEPEFRGDETIAGVLINDLEKLPSGGAFAVGTEAGSVTLTETSDIRIETQSLSLAGLNNLYEALSEEDKISLGGSEFFLLTEAEQIEVLIEHDVKSQTLDALENLATDTLVQNKSEIIIEGREIEMVGGSSIVAPGAEIEMRARNNPLTPLNSAEAGGVASITIGQGVSIDVSGTTGEVLDVDRNVVEIFVTSNELKDVAAQKDSALLRETVTIDIREGTDLLDWESSLASVEKSVDERLTDGGTITIRNTGATTIEDQSTIDVSAGYVTYEGGEFSTSQVIVNGKTLNIGDAPADIPVSGVVDAGETYGDHSKWGKRSSYSPLSHFFMSPLTTTRESYRESGTAGLISVFTNELWLDENVNLLAQKEAGLYQRTDKKVLDSGHVVFDLLSISNQFRDVLISADPLTDIVEFASDSVITAGLITNTGASNLEILTGGNVVLAKDSDLHFDAGTNLKLTGQDATIYSDISSSGGDVTVDANRITTLDATIDTSGTWNNDVIDMHGQLSRIEIDAGDISIESVLDMSESSQLVANAGAHLETDFQLTLGNAGDISIGRVGNDVEFVEGSSLLGSFESLDFAGGGTLTLVADDIRISNIELDEQVLTDSFVLSDRYFNSIEINNFNLIARNGDVTLSGDSVIELDNQQLGLFNNAKLAGHASADSLAGLSQNIALHEGHKEGVSLALSAYRSGPNQTEDSGKIHFENGSKISATAESVISLSAQDSIEINNSIDIVGGELNVTLQSVGGSVLPVSQISANNYIHIGENADISLNAGEIALPLVRLLPETKQIGAGSVDIDAKYGYVIIDDDAHVSLKGGIFNTLIGTGDEPIILDNALASGSFSISAERGLSMGAAIDFGEAGEGYRGGSLTVEMDPNHLSYSIETPPQELKMVLAGDNSPLDFSQSSSDESYVSELENTLYLSQETLNSNNIGNIALTVNNSIGTAGVQSTINVLEVGSHSHINASERVVINAANIDLNDSVLEISAPYVSLGSSNRNEDKGQISSLARQEGSGVLQVDSELFDLVGNTYLNNDLFVDVDASYGFRFRPVVGTDSTIIEGGLDAHGDIAINTPKLWGASLSNSTLRSEGFISLGRKGQNDNPVLSAGATINLEAEQILIDTDIEAPFGTINLNADELLTISENGTLSVATDQTVLLGSVIAEDFSWFYNPYNGALNAAPSYSERDGYPLNKQINLNGGSITVESGSVLDVSAGGDVLAREFIGGLNGSYDFFIDNAATPDIVESRFTNRFALVPGQQSGFSAYDLNELSGTDIPFGMSVQIKGSNQISDGFYTVMPISYALLPGAKIVTPGATSDFVNGGSRFVDEAGVENVSARFVGLDSSESINWQYMQINDSIELGKYSTYNILKASDYIDSSAQGVNPEHNGGLSLTALDSLEFGGALVSESVAATSAYLDINSENNIRVVNADSSWVRSDDELLILDSLFGDIDAGSVLLGGVRTANGKGWSIDAGSLTKAVTIDGANISANELVIAAEEDIILSNSASVSTYGDGVDESQQWQLNTHGVVMLSSAGQGGELSVSDAMYLSGSLLIDSGATVNSEGSMAVAFNGEDALRSSSLSTDGDLTLVSKNLNVGDVSEESVNVDLALLDGLKTLTLEASESVSFSQDLIVNTEEIVLSSAEVLVQENTSVTLNASESLSLIASGNTGLPGAYQQGSELVLQSKRVNINGLAGDMPSYVLLDAENVSLRATSQLGFQNNSRLSASSSNGTLNIVAPLIGATGSGAELAIETSGLLTLTGAGSESPELVAGHVGSNLSLAGASVELDTYIDVRAGQLTVQSNVGSILVDENALVDLSAYSVTHEENTLYSQNGSLNLISQDAISLLSIDQLKFSEQASTGNAQLVMAAVGALDIGGSAAAVGMNQSGSAQNLVIQAGQIANDETLTAIEQLNHSGFDGGFSLQVNAQDDFVFDRHIIADSFVIENNAGNLSIAGILQATGIEGNSVLSASAELELNASSEVSVAHQSDLLDGLNLLSQHGSIKLSDGATIDVPGALNVYLEASNSALSESAIDVSAYDAQNGGVGDVNVYLRTNASPNSVDAQNKASFELDLDAPAASNIVSIAVDNALTNKGAAEAIFGAISDKEMVVVRPHLDIAYDGDIDFSAFYEGSEAIFDLRDLRGENGSAGLLSLRAGGQLSVNSAISDGVDKVNVGTTAQFDELFGLVADNLNEEVLGSSGFFEDSLVLNGSDSASVYLSSGAMGASLFGAGQYASPHDLYLAENAYLRTGTGDLRVTASGDIEMDQGAYAATLGKTKVDADGLPVFIRELPILDAEGNQVQDENGNLLFKDMPYVSIEELSARLVHEQFGGFGEFAGDVSIHSGGSVVANTDSASWTDYLSQMTIKDFTTFLGHDLPNMNTSFVSLERVVGGVHSFGGGSIDLSVTKDVNNILLSTPSTGYSLLGSSPSNTLDVEGGSVDLRVGGSVSSSTLQNDDGHIKIDVLGSVTRDVQTGRSLLLGGSATDIQLNISNGLELDGIVNTPMTVSNTAYIGDVNPVSPVTQDIALKEFYFDAYDTTNLAITTLSGDLVLANDKEALASYYQADLLSQFYDVDAYLGSHRVLPSQVELTALNADVVLAGVEGSTSYVPLNLFPDDEVSLSIFASKNVHAAGRVYVNLPDFSGSALPNIDTTLDSDEAVRLFSEFGIFRPHTSAADLKQNHGDSIVERGDSKSLSVVALEGNLGNSEDLLRFRAPTAIDVYAGGSIMNAAFDFQHNNQSDISSITAGKDIVYPFLFGDNGGLDPSSGVAIGMGINVSGPGELLVIAGGDIDLGSSTGIRSIGQSENQFLPSGGANLNIFAGVSEFGDLDQLLATSYQSNDSFAGLNVFTSNNFESATFIDVAINYLNADLTQDQSEQLSYLSDLVARATGKDYLLEGKVDTVKLSEDYTALSKSLQNELATNWASSIALSSPELIESEAENLFTTDATGLTQQERSEVFDRYMQKSNSLLALAALLNENRESSLLRSNPGISGLDELADLPIYQQLNIAKSTFDQAGESEKLLVGVKLVNAQTAQGTKDYIDSGFLAAKIERGYVAQRMLFGDSYDFALKWMDIKTQLSQLKNSASAAFSALESAVFDYRNGTYGSSDLVAQASQYFSLEITEDEAVQLASVVDGLKNIEGYKFGGPGGKDLNDIQSVFEFWEQDSGVSFDYASNATSQGDISMLFTTIQTQEGGDINIYAPSGSIDVGQSRDQIVAIHGGRDNQGNEPQTVPTEAELGMLAFSIGSINSIVADAFNVNESRTIPLAGGDVNLWSAFGDIDAGKGAKTAIATPAIVFNVSPQSGLITASKSAAVSGSGISTRDALESFRSYESPRQRYNSTLFGGGNAVLATPFGVIDAGEAGIDVAGDLDGGSNVVIGNDNINVGGESTVTVAVPVNTNIAGLSSSIDAATESVQASAEEAATASANQQAAFVTIELL